MNFIILKVNGIDVSDSCHDEVISILNKAKQPVQVEILTKEGDQTVDDVNQKPTDLTNLVKKQPSKIDKQTQTDSEWLDDLVYQHCLKCQLDSNEPTKFQLKNNGIYEDPDDFSNCLDDELDNDFIDENCNAFEYKELNWSKTNPKESISLVLDKLDNDNKQNLILKTEIVYIKEILNPTLQSILKPGDQLLEINGLVVTNLEDTRQRLNNPLINEFNILFSRLNEEHDHKICEQRIKMRKEKVTWLKQNALRNMNMMNRTNELVNNIPNTTINNSEENDSGLGLGKQSTDQESVFSRTNETCSSDYELSIKKSNSTTSLEKEIMLLNKEMENIQFECELLNRNFQKAHNQNSSHCSIKQIRNQSTKTDQSLTRQLSDLSNNVSFSNQLLNNKTAEKKESIKKWINKSAQNGIDKDFTYVNSNIKFNDLNKKIDELNRLSHGINNISNKPVNRLSTSKTLDNLLYKKSGSMNSLNSIGYQNDLIKRDSYDCPSEHEYAVINYDNTSSLMNRQNNLKKTINNHCSNTQPPPLPSNHPVKAIKNTNKSNILNDTNSSEDNELKIATMYTNKANLYQTILLQQQMLRKAIEKKNSPRNLISNNSVGDSSSKGYLNSFNFNKLELPKCKKVDKNKLMLNNTIVKLSKKRTDGRYISRKLVDDNECKQKIINCNKNLINRYELDDKPKKSRDVDCKHILKTKQTKKTNQNKFFNGLKNKSNDKLEDKFRKMKLKDNLVVATV